MMSALESDALGAAVDTAFTEGLVKFCNTFRNQEVPAEAVRRSRDAITDTLACMVLGARQPLEPKLRRALFSEQAAAKLFLSFGADALRGSATEAQGSAA